MKQKNLDSPDKDKLVDIINTLQVNISDLQEHKGLSIEEYISDSNRMARKAIRGTFIESAEACVRAIDILLGYVVDSRPNNRKEKFKLAHREDLISKDLRDDMLSAVGFRDVLAHKYGAVIDHSLVHEAVQNDVDKYSEVVSVLRDYVQD